MLQSTLHESWQYALGTHYMLPCLLAYIITLTYVETTKKNIDDMRGKEIIQTILIALFLFVTQTAWAQLEVGETYSDEKFKYKCLSDGTVEIIEYIGTATEVTLPYYILVGKETGYGYASHTVSSLAAGVFEGNTTITSVSMAVGPYNIGDRAFYGCSNLKSIEFPPYLTSFGKEVLAYCNSLETISLYSGSLTGSGTTALGTDHGILYFTNDEGRPVEILACAPLGLKEGRGNITDKNAVKRINAGAFEGCLTLTEIANYPLLEEIGAYAFKNSTLEKCELTASKKLTKIGIGCFDKGGLQAVILEDNILTLAANSSVTEIPERAFYSCNLGENMPVFSAVTTIGREAFMKANMTTCDLTTMPKLYSISDWAFANSTCESVSCPASLTWIGNLSFWGTNKLRKVTFAENSLLQSIGLNAFRANNRYPYLKEAALQMELPENLSSISEGAFAETSFYTHYEDGEYSICIPKNVSSIGACAFSGHKGKIKNFVVDEENKYFTVEDGILFSKDMTRLLCCPMSNGMNEGEGVLAKGQEGYIIPPSVQKIDADAFYYCRFPHIVLPSKLTYIDSGTFANCTNLKDITIPANVKAIANGAFYLCNSMENMYFMPKTPPAMTEGLANSYINYTLKYKFAETDYTKGIYDPFGGFDCTLYTQLHVSGESSGENHPENYYKEKYADYIQTSENTFPVFKNVTNKIPFTMPSSGYMTLGRDFDVILPSELTSLVAYTVTEFDPVKAQVTLTAIKAKEVSGEETRTRFIPARYPLDGYDHGYIGVILKGTPGSTYYYYMPRNDYSTAERMEPADDYKNLAYPNLVETYREPEYQNTYKFVLNGGKIRRVTKAGILGYNKAYLRLPISQVEQMYSNGLGAKGLNVVFEDGETTTIEYAKTNIASKEDNKYYNLSGQCVENPTKGIYIKNGKKIVIK